MNPRPLIPNARNAGTVDGSYAAGPGAGVHVVAMDDDGLIAPVLFWPRGERVEIWYPAGCAGSLHRRVLFHWLTRPTQHIVLSDDTVTLACTAVSDIVLSLPGVTEWPVNRITAAELRHRLGP